MELTFVNNFYGKHSRVAHENGEQYLVCPVVMLVEGVHNGSNGSLFYPAAELAKKPSAWNGVPVTVYHPTINGVAVSASHPDVAPQKVGEIRNAKWDGKKLRAEAWIDTERLEEAAPELVDLIDGDAGVIEVSTGLFTDNEFQAGWFGGKNFELVARNHKPDHLAILPKGHGACSVSDGCGLFQTNEENNMHNETGLPLPTMDFGYKEPVLNAAEAEGLPLPTMDFGYKEPVLNAAEAEGLPLPQMFAPPPVLNHGGGDRDDHLLPLPSMGYEAANCGCAPVANVDTTKDGPFHYRLRSRALLMPSTAPCGCEKPTANQSHGGGDDGEGLALPSTI